MMEFYPELVDFYNRPMATLKEIVQANIRGNIAATAAEKAGASV